MLPAAELKFHLGEFLNRRMTGPSAIMLLHGIHDVFQTTRSSFSPVMDVRSAKISCTSQSWPSLGLCTVPLLELNDVDGDAEDDMAVLQTLRLCNNVFKRDN
jgi:hypothetical protein